MHQSGFKIQEVMLRLYPRLARRRESSMRGWSLKKLHQLHQKLIYLGTPLLVGQENEGHSQFFLEPPLGFSEVGEKQFWLTGPRDWKNIRIPSTLRDRVVQMTSASGQLILCAIPPSIILSGM